MLIDGQNGSFLAHPDKSLLLKPVTTLSSALDMRTIERAANQGELLALKLNGVEKFFFFTAVPIHLGISQYRWTAIPNTPLILSC